MKRSTDLVRRIIALTLFIALLPMAQALALTDIYDVYETTGDPIALQSPTQIFGPGAAESASGLINIGFDFYLDGVRYTQFSVSTAGLMSLGVTTEDDDELTHYFPTNSNLSKQYPLLAPYWGEDLEVSDDGGSIRYKVSGTAPFRILTVEWNDLQEFGSSTAHYGTFQVRLYESTNRIEFWYGKMKGSSSSSDEASIGVAASKDRYIHILGNDIPADVITFPDDETGTDYFLTKDPIDANTIYVFQPCTEILIPHGDLSEGGTSTMTKGDELLTERETMRGSVGLFYPFSLENLKIACRPISYSINFSGPHAGDYSASAGTIGVGETVTPEIRFRPSGHGTRSATMTVRTSEGQEFSWEVRAEGLTRIDWIGIIEQGGTPGIPNGSDLMTSIEQDRGTSMNYTPFVIDNLNQDPASTSTTITYTLTDPYGTYAISLDGNGVPTEGTTVVRETIGPDGSSQPFITFSPHADGFERGTGPQPATLTIEVDGLRRTYDLNAFGIDRALEIFADGERLLHSERRLFIADISCVGNEALSIPIRLENINREPLTIEGVEFYESESTIRQGTPPYPIALDAFGNPERAIDYFFTDGPGIAPVPVNRKTTFPLELEPGEVRTIYLNYVGQRPGRRYGRLFFRTDAVNLIDTDIEGYLPGSTGDEEEFEGLFTVDLFARSVGGALATAPDGSIDRLTLEFQPIRIGESTTTTTTIYNTGECDLIIAKRAIEIAAGDVEEFEIVSMLAGVSRDADGNWVLAPGASGDIVARFTPRGIGSRVATLKLPTNDSTLIVPGVTQRGVYYVDLFGRGLADLVVEDVELEPTVIDGDPTSGSVVLENVTGELIEIRAVRLVGPAVDAGEITATGWPSFPMVLNPLSSTELSLDFTPASGSAPGVREATIEIELESGEVIEVQVTGRAGTRLLEASPPVLFSGASVAPGETRQALAVLTNTGTFPIQITAVEIQGPGAPDYVFVPLTRTTIAPGGFEFVEITYAPTATGSSDATLLVRSNATSGDAMITLSGSSMGIGGLPDPNGSSTRASSGAAVGSTRSSISSVTTGTATAGALAVSEVRPNPARDRATISIALAQGESVTVDLYSLQGEHLARLHDGELSGNAAEIALPLDGLPEGAYFLRIASGSTVEHRSLRLVR